MRIRFNKIEWFIRVYDESTYLVLVDPEKFDATYNRSRYLIGLKSDMTYVFSHNYMKIKIDFYDSSPLEKKTLALHNAMRDIKPVFNKDQNH